MIVSNEVYEQALKNRDNLMIMHSAGSCFFSTLEADEIHRCKLMALWKALQAWQEGRGTKFTGFLYQQVHWECLKSINYNKKNKEVQAKYIEREALPDTPTYETLDGLPEELKNIVEKRYLYNMTLREIGDECGFSGETIRKRLKKASKYMKSVSKP